jgi:hypothetical protein
MDSTNPDRWQRLSRATICGVVALVAACGGDNGAAADDGASSLAGNVYQTKETRNGVPDGILELKSGGKAVVRAPHVLGKESIDLSYYLKAGALDLIEVVEDDTTLVDSGKLQADGCINFEAMGLLCKK